MENYDKNNRSKADVVRNTRHAASIHRSRKSVYGRVMTWEEENVGTDTQFFSVTLKPGWSFEEDYEANNRVFSTVSEAMKGISLTYKC